GVPRASSTATSPTTSTLPAPAAAPVSGMLIAGAGLTPSHAASVPGPSSATSLPRAGAVAASRTDVVIACENTTSSEMPFVAAIAPGVVPNGVDDPGDTNQKRGCRSVNDAALPMPMPDGCAGSNVIAVAWIEMPANTGVGGSRPPVVATPTASVTNPTICSF